MTSVSEKFFVESVVFYKIRFVLPHVYVTIADLDSPVYALWVYCYQSLCRHYYLAFKPFDFERTWWRLFHIIFDILVAILQF